MYFRFFSDWGLFVDYVTAIFINSLLISQKSPQLPNVSQNQEKSR
jgi:hypothetical protein